jgi:hypothetical protein
MDSVRADSRYSSNRQVNAALIGCTHDDRGIVDQRDDAHPYT